MARGLFRLLELEQMDESGGCEDVEHALLNTFDVDTAVVGAATLVDGHQQSESA